MWGDQPLPLIVVVDSGASVGTRGAAVLTPTGAPTSMRATWTRTPSDSVSVALRRIGYEGAIALGPEGASGRSGLARSGPAAALLEEVVVAGADARREDAPAAQSRAREGGRVESRKAAAAPRAGAAPAPAPPLRQLRVTARPIGCPIR